MSTKKSKPKKKAKAKAAKKKQTAVKQALALTKKTVKAQGKKPKSKAAVDNDTLFNCKIFVEKKKIMKAKAKKHAQGNLSAWVRFAACNMRPSASEQAQLDAGEW